MATQGLSVHTVDNFDTKSLYTNGFKGCIMALKIEREMKRCSRSQRTLRRINSRDYYPKYRDNQDSQGEYCSLAVVKARVL